MRRPLITFALAVGVVSASFAPAFANAPFIVNVAGQTRSDVAFEAASQSSVALGTPLIAMACTDATLEGMVLAGDTSGNPQGIDHVLDVADSSWNGCAGPLGLPMTVTQIGVSSVHATGSQTSALTDTFGVSIENVALRFQFTGCDFTATGDLEATLRETDQVLRVDQPFSTTFDITSITGSCFGLVSLLDPIEIEADFSIGQVGAPGTPLPINLR